MSITNALFTIDELNKSKSSDKLPLKCEICSDIFYRESKWIKLNLRIRPNGYKYCSKVCCNKSQEKPIETQCFNCKQKITITTSKVKQSKSGNNFCSKSCAATYNNTHKTKGTRRSKLEIWLEQQLKILYPELIILFNDKQIINSELDIYIPSLKLAFELNGIFHYEPIYGPDKFGKIQNNDNRKFQACLEQQIELVIIDSSGLKYFKPANAQKYLDIVTNIIKINRSSGEIRTHTH